MDSDRVIRLTEELQRLEHRLDQVVRQVARLEEENRVLRQSQDTLNAERAALLEKNELARSRIEAMISRLKAMEHH